jgi:hypothetical protein
LMAEWTPWMPPSSTMLLEAEETPILNGFMRRIDGGMMAEWWRIHHGAPCKITRKLGPHSTPHRSPKADLSASVPSNTSRKLKCERFLQEVCNCLSYNRASFWRLVMAKFDAEALLDDQSSEKVLDDSNVKNNWCQQIFHQAANRQPGLSPPVPLVACSGWMKRMSSNLMCLMAVDQEVLGWEVGQEAQ